MWPFPIAWGRRYYYTIRSTSQSNKLECRNLGMLHSHKTPRFLQTPNRHMHPYTHTHTHIEFIKKNKILAEYAVSFQANPSCWHVVSTKQTVMPSVTRVHVSPRLKRAIWSCVNLSGKTVPFIWPNSTLFHAYDNWPGKTHWFSSEWHPCCGSTDY